MQARHEYKILIHHADYLMLKSRMETVLRRDAHAGPGGGYTIRSLYFDTPRDKALREKIDGVNHREKFRLRYYNGDTGCIRLEKKSKHGSLCYKALAAVTAEETRALLAGDLGWMRQKEAPIFGELYVKVRGELLAPRTIVEYEREPFVFAPGNVRVTLDRHIRTGLLATDFLCGEIPLVPADETPALLEVKYDAFLPRVIRDVLQIAPRRADAFSKYAICRRFG